jgi:glycosyltransferase involved in cell wall biosynthesis
MTASSELSASDLRPAALDERWRAHTHHLQTAALPEGRAVVSCPAPLDNGGLGRHLREILDALERGGRPNVCIRRPSAGVSGRDADVELAPGWRASLAAPMARFSRAWRMWATSVDFDGAAARRLPAADNLMAFNGTALAQLRRAGGSGFSSGVLVSATSHVRHVLARHELAHSQYPIERPWVSRLLRRHLEEYRRAERILVSTGYIRESFLREGHDEASLVQFPLTPDPRYNPAGFREEDRSSTFDVVYVGGLLVAKGVPLLVDAIARLDHSDLRLLLVGGWGTRAMRRYLEGARARDPRVTVVPGDPLAALRRARLYVHPTYNDGFGYAPAEALACGLPVVVSEDTGMKELIDPGRNGLVVPTGEVEILADSIDAAYRGELLRG